MDGELAAWSVRARGGRLPPGAAQVMIVAYSTTVRMSQLGKVESVYSSSRQDTYNVA